MLLASCENSASKTSNDQAASAASFDDVLFRFAARQMYNGLLNPSCEDDPALDRAVVLAKEAARVAALEARLRATVSSYQLQVAREDWQQSEKGCWNDGDPSFAKMHIEIARDDVTSGLREVQRLASLAPPKPTDAADSRLPKAPAYRALVRTVVSNLMPLCELTSAAPDDVVLAQAREALGKYKDNARSTPYARQFAMAEADATYIRKHTVAECAISENEAPAAVSQAMLQETQSYIAQLAAISRPTAPGP